LVGYDGYNNGSGRNYWEKVFNYARTLDKYRPLTVPNCARAGTDDPVFEFCDIISLNRYYGWYDYPGRIEYGVEMLEKEMELIYKKYSKPIMMTEFGADTLPGSHSISDQMFTEEYQEKLLVSYIKLLRSKEYIVGEHVWNFADFKTPQNMRRMVLNLKGILNRNRTPKSAAFKLKELWLIPQTHGEK
jgi:beta-glucuronidase